MIAIPFAPMSLRIQIRRLPSSNGLPLPTYMTAGAAGMDLHAAVAEDLRLRLHRIGRAASTWSDVHTALASSALLGAGDVAVGISHSGETLEVLEPLTRSGRDRTMMFGLTKRFRRT